MSSEQAPVGEDDLQAYIDERLPEARRPLIEKFLEDHPEVAARVTVKQRQRAALRKQLEAKYVEPVPARLRISNIKAASQSRWAGRMRVAAAVLMIFLIGAGSGWYAGSLGPTAPAIALNSPTSVVMQDAKAAYRTFVVEVSHPVEVDTSDEGHLIQWLSNRLGRPLTLPNLSAFGYRLMGGRVLPGSDGAAAQLMYDDDAGTRLTVYIQASQGDETAFRFAQEDDISTFAWIDQGFGFAVTSEDDRTQLLPVAEAVYHGLTEIAAPERPADEPVA